MLKRKQGFTLVEIMVAMVAATILALSVGVVFNMPFSTMRTNNEYAQARRDLAHAMQRLAKDVRESSLIVDAVPSIVFDPSQGTLTLGTNHVRPNLPIVYQWVAANGSLTRNTEQVVAEGVTGFSAIVATNSPMALNGVILQLQLQNDDGYITVDNQAFVHTRN